MEGEWASVRAKGIFLQTSGSVPTGQAEAGSGVLKELLVGHWRSLGPSMSLLFYPQLYLELLLCGQESPLAPDRTERGAL